MSRVQWTSWGALVRPVWWSRVVGRKLPTAVLAKPGTPAGSPWFRQVTKTWWVWLPVGRVVAVPLGAWAFVDELVKGHGLRAVTLPVLVAAVWWVSSSGVMDPVSTARAVARTPEGDQLTGLLAQLDGLGQPAAVAHVVWLAWGEAGPPSVCDTTYRGSLAAAQVLVQRSAGQAGPR